MGRLSKDKRDVYYREAKREGFRARSAFKLLQIDDELGLLKGVRNVADLCAAPGGWSQVLALRLLGSCGMEAGDGAEAAAEAGAGDAAGGEEGARARIVAVDMYPMQPIPGVVMCVGDITQETTAREVLGHFGGELADLVVCDGAPDATGRADFDEHVQHQLLLSAAHLAAALLQPGGTFVAKVFRGERTGHVFAALKRHFEEVLCAKPRASRNSSQESFVVCRGFLAPADRGDGGLSRAFYTADRHEEMAYLGPGSESISVPFVACGGEDALDADTNYCVDSDHQVLGPIAPPLAAPYRMALEERRGTKRTGPPAPG